MNLAAELARSLGRDAYVRETHVSWVIVAGDSAFKLKKPVRFAFVDQSTAELRLGLCEEEVRINQPLAAAIVRDVAALVRDGDRIALAPAGAPGALDHVVVMRRFDDDDTLSGRLASGRITTGQIRHTARVLAAFHARCERAQDAEGPAIRWRRNFAELLEAIEHPDDDVMAALGAFGPAFCRHRAGELAARGRRGLVRDGHGDLRAEHVLIEGDDVHVVDRLEFDPALRQVDVAEDLGFLTMDLERLGAGWAADELVDAYRRAGGHPGPPALLAFFASYRALVRAKVSALAGQQDAARALVELAQRFAWRARRPLRMLVTGPPASGKSTVARAIADAAGVRLLSSDALRPRDAGGHARYDAASRARVYGSLAASARASDSFVVDATFGERRLQDAFFEAFGDGPCVAVVECAAPAAVLAERARRPRSGGSEAGPDVAVRLLERYVPCIPEGAPRLRVDTTDSMDRVLAHIAAWRDRQPCATRPDRPGRGGGRDQARRVDGVR